MADGDGGIAGPGRARDQALGDGSSRGSGGMDHGHHFCSVCVCVCCAVEVVVLCDEWGK